MGKPRLRLLLLLVVSVRHSKKGAHEPLAFVFMPGPLDNQVVNPGFGTAGIEIFPDHERGHARNARLSETSDGEVGAAGGATLEIRSADALERRRSRFLRQGAQLTCPEAQTC